MAQVANLTIKVNRSDAVVKSLRDLANTSVLIGIPAEKNPRSDSAPGNATLAFIHENGSPVNGIPPRPFLVPGVTQSKDKWLRYLSQAYQLALSGNFQGSERALRAAGQTAVSAVKSRIVAGIPPPLKTATIAARRQRSRGSSYRRKATTAKDTTPLVDSAQLLNSITYALRKK